MKPPLFEPSGILLAMLILIIVGWIIYVLPAEGRDLKGEYANSPLRPWYEAQHVPGGRFKGQSCCTVADGADAQEDIREGQYWTTWTVKHPGGKEVVYPWQPVPPEAVLTGPNPRGVPIVWWFLENAKAVIRCFAPGVKM